MKFKSEIILTLLESGESIFINLHMCDINEFSPSCKTKLLNMYNV